MNTIITYKYYDQKGRRLAIMAKKLNETHTEITIITCSKLDQFNKRFARHALSLCSNTGKVVINKEEIHPQTVVIAHYGEFRKSFFEWASDNYYKIEYGVKNYNVTYLVGKTHKFVTHMEANHKLW